MKTTTSIATALTLFGILLATLPAAAAPAAPAAEGRGIVNINTAEAAQLALLPRVGPSVAGRIVEFRKQNGPFKTTDDLLLVRGIGERTYALIKPYVATAGETTLTSKVKTPRAGSGDGSR